MANPKIAVGDRVMYSRRWLRAVGAYTGDLPHLRGTVTEIRRICPRTTTKLCRVKWDGEQELTAVLLVNLTLADRPEPL